ncbi:MAG TPA: transposase [Jiangellaceae bacterium]|nr:transposase [Jiangellaceae bacterium]
MIATIKPRDIVGETRRRLAGELIVELEAIDKTIKAVKQELRDLIVARGSTLMELTGIGPSGAARLLVDVGDIHRFADRDTFASWNGTAPLNASSGEQTRHRLSRTGNRRINRALHIMAVVQLRNPTEGRTYFDAKKTAGKTSMEAMRALKRRLSNVVERRMRADQNQRESTGPGGHSGTTLQSSVTDLTPDIGSSDKPLPGPAYPKPRTALLAALDLRGAMTGCVRRPQNGRSLINDQFQQGVIWVPEVDTHAPTTATTANDRPLLYLDLIAAKVSQDLLDGAGPHETQVAASRHNRWARHQRADVQTRSVHVELLIAKPVSDMAVRVVNNLGSQHISIELRRPFPVAHRDHTVVEFDSYLSHG